MSDIDELNKLGVYGNPKTLQRCLDALDVEILTNEDRIMRGLLILAGLNQFSDTSLLSWVREKYANNYEKMIQDICDEVTSSHVYHWHTPDIWREQAELTLDSVPSIFPYFGFDARELSKAWTQKLNEKEKRQNSKIKQIASLHPGGLHMPLDDINRIISAGRRCILFD